MTVSITISGPALDLLKEQRATLASDGVKKAAGNGVRLLLMDYLGGLDSSRPNAVGGRRTHFYAQAARGITYDVTPDGAEVAIHQEGIAQRFYGGKIEPVNSKYLTIPVDPEAYGRRAGEFDNLTVQWGRSKGGKARPMFLTETPEDKKTKGRIMYYLAESVEQDPDPTVLPDDDLVMQSAVASISRYLLSKRGTQA